MSLSQEKKRYSEKALQTHRCKIGGHPGEGDRDETSGNPVSRKMKRARKAQRILTRWTASWHNREENDRHLLVANECAPDCTKIKDKKVTFVQGIPSDDKKRMRKKSKKGWKRIRHAALLACRYIGMGVSQLSPVTTYSSPDYYIDSHSWCNPYDVNYNSCRAQPHWTTGLFLNGW